MKITLSHSDFLPHPQPSGRPRWATLSYCWEDAFSSRSWRSHLRAERRNCWLPCVTVFLLWPQDHGDVNVSCGICQLLHIVPWWKTCLSARICYLYFSSSNHNQQLSTSTHKQQYLDQAGFLDAYVSKYIYTYNHHNDRERSHGVGRVWGGVYLRKAAGKRSVGEWYEGSNRTEFSET